MLIFLLITGITVLTSLENCVGQSSDFRRTFLDADRPAAERRQQNPSSQTNWNFLRRPIDFAAAGFSRKANDRVARQLKQSENDDYEIAIDLSKQEEDPPSRHRKIFPHHKFPREAESASHVKNAQKSTLSADFHESNLDNEDFTYVEGDKLTYHTDESPETEQSITTLEPSVKHVIHGVVRKAMDINVSRRERKANSNSSRSTTLSSIETNFQTSSPRQDIMAQPRSFKTLLSENPLLRFGYEALKQAKESIFNNDHEDDDRSLEKEVSPTSETDTLTTLRNTKKEHPRFAVQTQLPKNIHTSTENDLLDKFNTRVTEPRAYFRETEETTEETVRQLPKNIHTSTENDLLDKFNTRVTKPRETEETTEETVRQPNRQTYNKGEREAEDEDTLAMTPVNNATVQSPLTTVNDKNSSLEDDNGSSRVTFPHFSHFLPESKLREIYDRHYKHRYENKLTEPDITTLSVSNTSVLNDTDEENGEVTTTQLDVTNLTSEIVQAHTTASFDGKSAVFPVFGTTTSSRKNTSSASSISTYSGIETSTSSSGEIEMKNVAITEKPEEGTEELNAQVSEMFTESSNETTDVHQVSMTENPKGTTREFKRFSYSATRTSDLEDLSTPSYHNTARTSVVEDETSSPSTSTQETGDVRTNYSSNNPEDEITSSAIETTNASENATEPELPSTDTSNFTANTLPHTELLPGNQTGSALLNSSRVSDPTSACLPMVTDDSDSPPPAGIKAAGIFAGTASGIIVVGILGFYIYRRRRGRRSEDIALLEQTSRTSNASGHINPSYT